MEPCTIRYAVAEDYPQVESIMKEVQTLHINWRPDIYKQADVVLPFSEFTQSVENHKLIVAVRGENVVGLLSFFYRHVASDKQVTRDILFISDLAVKETHRGQGIGTQLLDYMKKKAREEHMDGLELQVNAKNLQARQMYEKNGFTEKSINMELL